VTTWRSDPRSAARARDWAHAEGRLFTSPGWAEVIATLGCKSDYAWNDDGNQGMLVPVFRRGPLRVGFLGFPVAPVSLSGQPGAMDALAAGELAGQLKLHVVRANLELPPGAEALEGVRQPDAWIDDLPAWSEGASKRRAKDLAFARRATRSLQIREQGCDPGALYDLYAAVVRANRGKARYTAAYFARLMAAVGDRLRVVHATEPGGRLMGAAVLAMDGDTGYYLHSAVASDARALGTSDILLSRLVELARAAGMRRFGLMASPPGQPGLLKFKAKWADREGAVLTRDRGFGWIGRAVVRANALITARCA